MRTMVETRIETYEPRPYQKCLWPDGCTQKPTRRVRVIRSTGGRVLLLQRCPQHAKIEAERAARG